MVFFPMASASGDAASSTPRESTRWRLIAGLLLIFFRGVTDRLIPLYAVGAFLAFTLSQAGMVSHWRRVKGPGAGWNMFVNGLGAVATGITVLVVLVAKFVEGAWITALLIPALLILMLSVRRHFKRIEKELQCDSPLDLSGLNPPFVIVPVQRWGMPVEKALRFALTISKDIEAVHVPSDAEKSSLQEDWSRFVEEPAEKQGLPAAEIGHPAARLTATWFRPSWITSSNRREQAPGAPDCGRSAGVGRASLVSLLVAR